MPRIAQVQDLRMSAIVARSIANVESSGLLHVRTPAASHSDLVPWGTLIPPLSIAALPRRNVRMPHLTVFVATR